MKTMKKQIALLLLIIICASCKNEVTKSVNLLLLQQQLSKASPGDTIRIKAGVYKDVRLELEGYGKEGLPVVVEAEQAGTVFVEGASNLRLCGEYVELSGMFFRNGYSPDGAVIEFRNGNKVANHCRITGNVISYFNPESRSTKGNWVVLYGKNNRFDHNSLIGKLNADVTLTVILSEERHQKNHHRIDHNYFGYRPVLGSNGGETIRVGTSHHAFFSSNTVIEDNMFERCDGEVEIVSIKSSDNIIRNNVFLESAGVLALRHGNRNRVESNIFFGNGKLHTGGVRVVNEGHTIKDNLFVALTGDRFFAALALMNAVPNSLPNRYHQVKDVCIENNCFVDCDNILFGAGKDNERTLPPSNILIKGNRFINKTGLEVYRALDDIRGFKFEENRVNYATTMNLPGFVNDAALSEQIDLCEYIKNRNYGASWYTVEEKKPRGLSGQIVSVEAGVNTLYDAIRKAKEGDVIQLETAGEYWNDVTLPVDKYLRIQAAEVLSFKPVLRYNGEKKEAIITLMKDGHLDIEGIAFDGGGQTGKAFPSGGISTAVDVNSPYLLTVNHCEFYHFNESDMAAIRGRKSTFSPLVIIRNSCFYDMSGEGINYAGETDDKGKYNVEQIIVEDCRFYRILNSALNVYRGGNDESTSGPCVVVKGCDFNSVDNKEQGTVVRLLGVQQADISHCVFTESGKGGASIRFNEMSWDKISVSDVTLKKSGRISSFWGNVVKGNITVLD